MEISARRLVTFCNRVHRFQRTMEKAAEWKQTASGGPQRVKAIVTHRLLGHENALGKLYPPPENCTLATRPEKLYPRKIVPSKNCTLAQTKKKTMVSSASFTAKRILRMESCNHELRKELVLSLT